MSETIEYASRFFDALYPDEEKNGHFYKTYLRFSIAEFLQNETKKNAYDVFSTFFDMYRMKNDSVRSFIDLLDVLKLYEENASTLSGKQQRDHYVHSVNVFILGLCIYAQNPSFRNAFKNSYRASAIQHFSTEAEEFLFRWGIASLFHDIGYPVEIINNQLNRFIRFVSVDRNNEIRPYISYSNFGKLNSIGKSDLQKRLLNTASTPANFNCTISTDLIALHAATTLGVDYSALKEVMDNFLIVMQQSGFVDHGFYSSLIVLKWYGELLFETEAEARIFMNQILDSAASIFLHNAYRAILQKKPFMLGPLRASRSPIGFLLMLCDEAQEWNRKAYGIVDKQEVCAESSRIEIEENKLHFHYMTKTGVMADSFLKKKRELLYALLDIDDMFGDGVAITATTYTERYIEALNSAEDFVPRPLISNIESMAQRIHSDYNQRQLSKHPDKPLEYPDWGTLPDTLKYSNLRQARAIVDKLAKLSYFIAESDDSARMVEMLTEEEVEHMARYEHELWMEERIQTGWTYGEAKDVEAKRSPYLVPYDDLSEEIKELDRETVRNIIPLLKTVGLHVFSVK